MPVLRRREIPCRPTAHDTIFAHPVKIDVLASPRKIAIEPRAAAAAAEISQRVPSLRWERGEQRITLPISAGDPADWTGLASEWASAFTAQDSRNLDLSATVNASDEPGVASANPEADVVAGWTPDSGKLRDVNGSAVHAALPKVLAGLAASASRVSAPLETGQPTSKKSFRARSVVVAHTAAHSVVAVSGNRYAALDPRQGAVVAVAESLRELACRGAAPLGFAEDVRIGTPLTGASFRRLIDLFRGVLDAAAAFKVTSLSTALTAAPQRETEFLIAAIGVSDHGHHVPPFARAPGDRLVFLGDAPSEIGASQYLQSVHGLVAGDVPAVNFAAEQRLHDVLNTLVKAGIATAARDISAGGLLSAVCALLLGGEKNFGALLDLTTLGGSRADALLFGESQSRAVITVAAERVGTVLSEAHMRGVSAALIGEVTDGSALVLKTRSLETEWPLATLLAAAS